MSGYRRRALSTTWTRGLGSAAGTVTPAHKVGGDYTYHIDARGADLGAANRTARAIEVAHNAAVQNSMKAQQEHAKRTPQRSR